MATATKEKPRTIREMPNHVRLTREIEKLEAKLAEVNREREKLPPTEGPAPDPTRLLLVDDLDAARLTWKRRYEAADLAAKIDRLKQQRDQSDIVEGGQLYQQTYFAPRIAKLQELADHIAAAQRTLEELKQQRCEIVAAGVPGLAGASTTSRVHMPGFPGSPQFIPMLAKVDIAREQRRLAELAKQAGR